MESPLSVTVFCRIIIGAALLLTISSTTSLAAAEKFISLDDLKPGMKGVALSVFRGTEPESFTVELQGVIDGPVAGSKYMLLKASDASLRMGSGFSGSPVYFDGRLAGAISHMEPNLASQIVMAVPIARMQEDGNRKVAVTTADFPVTKSVLPGSMIAIPQVRGDFWMGSSGTVTYIENDLLLAFGHENLFSGDSVQLPIHRATVHGVIPRLDLSHKEASPLEEIGSITWDGKSALVGRLGSKAAMAQLIVEFKGTNGSGKRFNLEIINNGRLAAGIITRVARAIVNDHLPNRPGGVDLDVTLTLSLHEFGKPVVINQRFNVTQLMSDSAQNPLQALLAALFIPLPGKAPIKSISMTINELVEAKTARIAEASFSRTRVRAGESVSLRVRLSGPFGEVKDVSLPITIPADYTGSGFTVAIHPGRSVRPAEVSPGSIEEIAAWLAAVARGDELVVLAPGSVVNSAYPEARLSRTVARTPWNLEGNCEATISVVAE